MNYINIAKPCAGNAIRAELIGSETAHADGITTHGPAPLVMLCRKLVAAGIDPDQALIAWRDHTLCLIVRSIGAAARLTVDEHNGTRFARWKPFCHSAGSPRIALNGQAAP